MENCARPAECQGESRRPGGEKKSAPRESRLEGTSSPSGRSRLTLVSAEDGPRPREEGRIRGRGFGRSHVFLNDGDRTDFLSRLAALWQAGHMVVFGWALMPNHFHLLVRTGGNRSSEA